MTRILVFFVLLLALPMSVLGSQQILPYGVQRIGGPAVDAADVDVAVIDTGVDPTHPDLNVVGGVDCTGERQMVLPFRIQGAANDNYPRPVTAGLPDWADGHGHGTHVAGTIAALDNGYGVVGVAPGARIWSVRVLNSMGGGTDETVRCGLEWVRDHADIIDVANMSLGGSLEERVRDLYGACGDSLVKDTNDDRRPNPEMKFDRTWQVICELKALNIPVVVAAGNADEEVGFHVPAAYPEAITVSNFADFDGKPGGAAGLEDRACPNVGGFDDQLWTHHNNTPKREYTSSYGYGIDFAGPGTCIFSTVPGGYAFFTGTSMATPHVTGAIASYLAQHPGATWDEIYHWLVINAEKQEPSFHDVDTYHEPIVHLP